MPMKICVSGKGGVGKTTFAGTLARFLAKSKGVIAIDADPDFNLHHALGLRQETIEGLVPLSERKELISERTGAPADSFGSFFRMNPKVSDIPEKIWIETDNVKYILLGTVKRGGSGCACPANVLLQRFLQEVFLRDYHVVVDMEAGIEHLGRATSRYTDLLLIVVEPSLNSIQTAKNIMKLAEDIGIRKTAIVGNKTKEDFEKDFIEKSFPNCLGIIPYDETVRRLDMEGESLYEHNESVAYSAIEDITKRILGG